MKQFRQWASALVVGLGFATGAWAQPTVKVGVIFPLSGGVIAQTWRPALPAFLLDLVEWLDRGLVALAPNVCAMGRSLVLQKVG